jgi:hypothetical protein
MEPLDQPTQEPENLEYSNDDKTMAMVAHLSALSGYVIPFGNILGPLVVYLTQKDKSEFITYHAKESLNFQITVFLALIVSGILTIVVIGIPLLIAVAVGSLVLTIIAGIRANEGKRYQYPWKIKFIA